MRLTSTACHLNLRAPNHKLWFLLHKCQLLAPMCNNATPNLSAADHHLACRLSAVHLLPVATGTAWTCWKTTSQATRASKDPTPSSSLPTCLSLRSSTTMGGTAALATAVPVMEESITGSSSRTNLKIWKLVLMIRNKSHQRKLRSPRRRPTRWPKSTSKTSLLKTQKTSRLWPQIQRLQLIRK